MKQSDLGRERATRLKYSDTGRPSSPRLLSRSSSRADFHVTNLEGFSFGHAPYIWAACHSGFMLQQQ